MSCCLVLHRPFGSDHLTLPEAMGTGLSTRKRSRSRQKKGSRRESTASDETTGTVGTRGTTRSTKSNRSMRSESSNRSNTSAGSKGSGRRLRIKAAITAAKQEALEARAREKEKEIGIVPAPKGRFSVVLEDVDEEDWEFEVGDPTKVLNLVLPASHPSAVEGTPE